MRKSFIDLCLRGSVLVKTIDYTLERSSVKPMAGLVNGLFGSRSGGAKDISQGKVSEMPRRGSRG
jgi:hypothetical protein